MQISPHRAPLKFKGVAEVGKESPQIKKALDSGAIESHTFPLDGKTYRVWEDEIDTLQRANSQYTRDTLIHPVTEALGEHGKGHEVTKDAGILAKAQATFEATLKKLVATISQPKPEAKETKTQET